jgi:dolichol kinase
MSGFNYKRKLFHLLGFILPYLYFIDIFKDSLQLVNASRAIIFSILAFQVFILVITETLRLNHQPFKDWYFKNFGMIMKEEEQDRMNATIPYLFSNAVVVLFFPAEIFFISVGFLLIGDPVAAYFGSKYGTFRFYNGKSLVGVIAFTLASILVGLFFMFLFMEVKETSSFALFVSGEINLKAIISVFIAGILSALAEFFSGHGWKGFLDDNLTIPLAASFTLAFALVFFFGIDSKQIFFAIETLYKTF